MRRRGDQRWLRATRKKALTTTVCAADVLVASIRIFDTRKEGWDPVGEQFDQQNVITAKEANDVLLLSFHEQVLEIEQGLLGGLHVDEGGGNSRLSGTSSTSDLMDVVLYGCGHKSAGDRERGREGSAPQSPSAW